MKSNLVVLSLAALILTTTIGFAGSGVAMRVTVPFDFYAGDQQLPAGEYNFEMGAGSGPTSSLVTVRSKEGAGICMLTALAGSFAGTSSNEVLFNKYGDTHFLSSVSIRGHKANVKMLKTEKEFKAQIERSRNVETIAQK